MRAILNGFGRKNRIYRSPSLFGDAGTSEGRGFKIVGDQVRSNQYRFELRNRPEAI